MGPLRALVIEDAQDSARLVSFNLQRAGFETQVVETGAEGLRQAAAWRPEVIVLDIGLPDIEGFEVCAELRNNVATKAIGVLVLTAQGLSEHRVRALELGADDYLTKPFIVRELILRVTALARRIGAPVAREPARVVETIRCGPIELDPRSLEVRVSGAVVDLRPVELRLLQVFLERPGVVFSRKELLRRVWGNGVAANSRVVDVTMHRLRSVLGEQAMVLETIHEGGYRLWGHGAAPQ